MTKQCQEIVDMIAEGEPLGDEQEAHVGKCLTCARTLETRDLIRATTDRRNEVKPRPGFASRAASGALRKSVQRRRRGGIALVGATVAAGALTAAFFMMKPKPMKVKKTSPVVAIAPLGSDVTPENVDTTSVQELLDLSDIDGSMSVKANWDWLNDPLAPERLLAEEIHADEDQDDDDSEEQHHD